MNDFIVKTVIDTGPPKPVEMSEIKRGRWEKKWNSYFKQDVPCCSVCGKYHPMITLYCPNCGAKMDEVDNG